MELWAVDLICWMGRLEMVWSMVPAGDGHVEWGIDGWMGG